MTRGQGTAAREVKMYEGQENWPGTSVICVRLAASQRHAIFACCCIPDKWVSESGKIEKGRFDQSPCFNEC